MKPGTRLRHVSSDNLKTAEAMLESLPYRSEVVAVTNVAGTWFIHFAIPTLLGEELSEVSLKLENAEETKTKTKRKNV